MKRYLILSLAGILGLMSCSHTDIEAPQVSQSETRLQASPLLHQLKGVNDSLLLRASLTSRPRGFWSSMGRALYVAARDIEGAAKVGAAGAAIGTAVGGPHGTAAGAVIGGTIGAVGYSYHAYTHSRGSMATAPQGSVAIASTPSPSLSPSTEARLSDYMSVHTTSTLPMAIAAYEAVHHNEATARSLSVSHEESSALGLSEEYASCVTLSKEHNAMLEVMQTQSYPLGQLSALSHESEEILFHPDLLRAYEEADVTMTTTSVPGKTLSDRVMQLFISAYKQYPGDKEDILELTRIYISAVQTSSELTKSEKEIILRALPLAIASYNYWETHL